TLFGTSSRRKKHRKRKQSLPPGVRRHHDGYRAVIAKNHRRYTSMVVPTIEEAVRLAEVMRGDTFLGEVLTLERGFELLFANLDSAGRKDGTKEGYLAQQKPLYQEWPPNTPLAQIGPREINAYISRRRKQVSDSSVRKE